MTDTHTTSHIPDEAVQAALLSLAKDNIGTDVQGLLMHGFDKLNAKPNALRNALAAALPHLQPVDVAAVPHTDLNLICYDHEEDCLSAEPVTLIDELPYEQLIADKSAENPTVIDADELALGDQWQPIETAPKGFPSEDAGCRGVSEWFMARPSKKYRKIGASPIVVIRRRAWPHEDSWMDNGETYYVPDYFEGWMPLPADPTTEAGK